MTKSRDIILNWILKDSRNLSFHKTRVVHLCKQTFDQYERIFRSCACNTFGQQVIYNREFLLNNRNHTFDYLDMAIVRLSPWMGFQTRFFASNDLIGCFMNSETQLSNFWRSSSFDSRRSRCSDRFSFGRVNLTIWMTGFPTLSLSRRPF